MSVKNCEKYLKYLSRYTISGSEVCDVLNVKRLFSLMHFTSRKKIKQSVKERKKHLTVKFGLHYHIFIFQNIFNLYYFCMKKRAVYV